MKLNDYSFDFKSKIFPKSVPIGCSKFLFRPRFFNIEQNNGKYLKRLSDIAPYKLYKVLNSNYLIHILTKTDYLNDYRQIENVWKIGDTLIIYEKGLGVFVSEKERISLSPSNKDDFKTESTRVFRLNYRGCDRPDRVVTIGPTKFRDRISFAFELCRSIVDFKNPGYRGFNLYKDQVINLTEDDKLYVISGRLLDELIDMYVKFGTIKPIKNINKVLIKIDENEELFKQKVNEAGSIRAEELF